MFLDAANGIHLVTTKLVENEIIHLQNIVEVQLSQEFANPHLEDFPLGKFLANLKDAITALVNLPAAVPVLVHKLLCYLSADNATSHTDPRIQLDLRVSAGPLAGRVIATPTFSHLPGKET